MQYENSAPLDAVSEIASAIGAVVDGTPTEAMWIRYPRPHPMNSLSTAVVSHYYTDAADNISVSEQYVYRDGANKFRIRDGDASYGDTMEWVLDEPQTDPVYTTGLLKAYLSPYRANVKITHLGNAAYVVDQGEATETLEELIEFNAGIGNTNRPIESLGAVTWLTASLGQPSFTPFSSVLNVPTTTNWGYGLAKVVYNAKYLVAKVGGIAAYVNDDEIGPPSAYAYFVLEDSNG
jgi:hypothetical protein